jgi:long-chain acyl-CoA synthetase
LHSGQDLSCDETTRVPSPAFGAEVTVIGIPDPYRGQSAKAFIALKPGHPPFGIDELRAFLTDKLAKYEMPTQMEIRASLPKTPVGKLSKKALLAEKTAKRQATDPVPAGAREVA